MPNQVDPRNLRTGRAIPSEFYADQPCLVKAADGAWVCVMTTGAGLSFPLHERPWSIICEH
jgi:hypothetical protein